MDENICRFCMEIAHRGIFERDILDKVISCLDLKIYFGDGLPSNICEACEKKINDFYIFKEKCLEVAAILRATPKFMNTPSPSNEDFVDIQEFVNINFLEKYHYTQNQSNIKNEDNTQDEDIPLETIEIDVNIENDLAQEKPKLQNTIQCETCGQILKTLSTLKQHSMICHSKTKPYTCHLCSKNFTRKFHMDVHMRCHSGEKPFVCNNCGKAIGRRQDLIRHMRIHSEERNYSCLKCKKRFKRSWDVHVHMRTHTGVKPYACNPCMKRYSTFSAFQKHLKSNTHVL